MLLEISREECKAIYQKIQAIKDPLLIQKYDLEILKTWEARSFIYTQFCIEKDANYKDTFRNFLGDEKDLFAFDVKHPSSKIQYTKEDLE